MLGQYYHHQSVRKLVSIFGTLFNNIQIKRRDSDGIKQTPIKVPIAFGPRQHYLARIDTPDRELQMVLPRMSYEFTTITYDDSRKLTTTTKIKQVANTSSVASITVTNGGTGYTDATPPTVIITGGGGEGATAIATVVSGIVTAVTVTNGGTGYTSPPTITFDNTAAGGITSLATATAVLIPTADIIQWAYNPVPYNFDFVLTIAIKNVEDGLQILEQILPYFTPGFNVALKEFPELGGITRDIPIILDSVQTEDTFEADLVTRRALLYTLAFTVKAHLYGPVNQQKLIKDVTISTSVDPLDLITASTYNVVPNPTTAGPNDVFTYTETKTNNF